MKVKFEFDASWHMERIIEVKDNISKSEIEDMFPCALGVKYDKNTCKYSAVTGKIYSKDEILAYTE